MSKKIGLFFVFLLLLPFIASEKVNVVSQDHGLIEHEVVLEIDSTLDFVDYQKEWTFFVESDSKNIPENIRFFELTRFEETKKVFSSEQVLCKEQPKDVNGNKCYETVTTFEEVPHVYYDWIETTSKETYYTGIKQLYAMQTPKVSLEKGTKKIVKVTWKTPIKKEWVSSGTWTMNPSDNFITECDYRQELQLNTSVLDANVDQDIAIMVDINSDNTSFWSNETYNDGNGITFTDVDGTTELDFDNSYFNSTDQNAVFWVEYTKSFSHLNDTNIFMYYKCTDQDYSDGAGAYPSEYTAVWHLDETSGTNGVDAVGDYNLTHKSSPDVGEGGKINYGIAYDGSNSPDPTSNNATILDGGATNFSFSTWFKRNTTDALGDLWKKDNGGNSDKVYLNGGGSSLNWVYIETDTTAHQLTDNISGGNANTWYHLIGTLDTTNNKMVLYVNGSDSLGGILEEAMPTWDAGTTQDFNLGANVLNVSSWDEFKVYDGTTLDSNTAKLIYLSESGQLIEFFAEEENVAARFNVSGTDSLDPENGVNSVTRDLNNTSTLISTSNFTWFVNDVNVSSDVNYTHTFSTVGDYNVFLAMVASGGTHYSAQEDVNINQYPQSVAFTPLTADKGTSQTFTGTSTDLNSPTIQWYWNFPNPDTNYTGNPVSHTFNAGGIQEVCLTAQNTADLNKTSCLDVNVGGSLTINVYDENKGVAISGATIDFNFGTYTTDANGQVSIPLTGINSQEYTISVDVNSDFTARTFIYDLNGQSDINRNIMLLETDKGLTISFTLYNTDEAELLTNAFIDFNRTDVIYEGLASRVKTDSSGQVSVFVNTDSDYNLLITASDGNTLSYFPTTVTVKPPKKESDGTTISPVDFDVTVGGLAQSTYGGQSAEVSFSIFSNTTNYYQVSVDANESIYYDRKYQIRSLGDTSTVTIQPYLASTTDGISVTLKTKNRNDLTPLTDVLVKIYKYISGEGRVEIESVVTDDKGEAFTSGIVNDEYEYEVYYNNNLVFQPTILVSGTEVTLLFTPDSVISIPDTAWVDVFYYPFSGKLIDSETTLNQEILAENITITSVDINVIQSDGTNLYTTKITDCATTCTNTITIASDLSSWDINKQIEIRTDVLLSNGATFTKKTVHTRHSSISVSMITILKEDTIIALGCSVGEDCGILLVVALLLTLGAMIIVTASTTFRSAPAVLGIGAIALGLFSYINWVPFEIVFLWVLVFLVSVWLNQRFGGG